jgi:hypothetical protein
MRRSLARFSERGASHRFPSWADSITDTLEFSFSVHTGHDNAEGCFNVMEAGPMPYRGRFAISRSPKHRVDRC